MWGKTKETITILKDGQLKIPWQLGKKKEKRPLHQRGQEDTVEGVTSRSRWWGGPDNSDISSSETSIGSLKPHHLWASLCGHHIVTETDE